MEDNEKEEEYKKSGTKVFTILVFLSFFPTLFKKSAPHSISEKRSFPAAIFTSVAGKYSLLVE